MAAPGASSPSTGPSARAFSKIDKLILGEIIQVAENSVGGGTTVGLGLLDVLRAYDTVLRRHGLSPSEDSLYYRCLLKLSQNHDEPDWWRRLDAEYQVNLPNQPKLQE